MLPMHVRVGRPAGRVGISKVPEMRCWSVEERIVSSVRTSTTGVGDTVQGSPVWSRSVSSLC